MSLYPLSLFRNKRCSQHPILPMPAPSWSYKPLQIKVHHLPFVLMSSMYTLSSDEVLEVLILALSGVSKDIDKQV